MDTDALLVSGQSEIPYLERRMNERVLPTKSSPIPAIFLLMEIEPSLSFLLIWYGEMQNRTLIKAKIGFG